jgi:hypothetical protein
MGNKEVTKDEAISVMDQMLMDEIPDHTKRWTVVERIYRDVVKRAQDDATSDMVPFVYAKPE